jgi:hypothetical protein
MPACQRRDHAGLRRAASGFAIQASRNTDPLDMGVAGFWHFEKTGKLTEH